VRSTWRIKHIDLVLPGLDLVLPCGARNKQNRQHTCARAATLHHVLPEKQIQQEKYKRLYDKLMAFLVYSRRGARRVAPIWEKCLVNYEFPFKYRMKSGQK